MSYNQPLGFEEAFGKLIADTTYSELDVPSHYDFSPERLRLFVNGNRAFVQYEENISQFSDASDSYDLVPESGDFVGIETVRAATYQVGYVIQTSISFGLSQSLKSGDVIRWGPFRDGEDGWFYEQRGADHTDKQVDIKQLRDGTETTLKSEVSLPRSTTNFLRYVCRWNWYNVGNQEWFQTYTEDGEQINEPLTETSFDSGRGPANANLPIRFDVQASNTTSNLKCNVGSFSHILLGNTELLSRQKAEEKVITVPEEVDTWHPIYAVRIQPGSNPNVSLAKLSVLNYSNDARIQVLAISVHASKTDASDFSTPELQSSQNSIIQVTENVSTIPNSSGTEVDPNLTTEPGGFQVGYSSLAPVGNNFQQGASSSEFNVKRPIYDSDVIVFCARTSVGTGELIFSYNTDQLW